MKGVKSITKVNKTAFSIKQQCRRLQLSLTTYVRGTYFQSFRAYIRINAIGPHFCADSSFNQHRNQRGCVGTDTPKRR